VYDCAVRTERPALLALAIAAVAATAGPAAAAPGKTPPAGAAPRIDCDTFESQVELSAGRSAHRAPNASQVVPPNVIAGQRIAGSPMIQPPRSDQDDMLRTGRHRAIASVKMCVGTDGRITSERLLKLSGLPGWDRRLCESIRDWRYLPFEVDGKPVPVCTSVTFIYSQSDADTPKPAAADEARAASRTLLQAIAAGDARAFAAHVRVPFMLHDMWFDTRACRTEFSGEKLVSTAQLPALVRCLHRVGAREAQGADRVDWHPNLIAWSYGPGALTLSAYIRSDDGVVLAGLVSYWTPRESRDATAPVSPAALERHRVSGTAIVDADAAGRAEATNDDRHHVVVRYTVCLDRTGRITKATIDDGPPAYSRTVAAAIHQWRFRRFLLHGKALAVCAEGAVVYPHDGYVAAPLPPPPPPPPPGALPGPRSGPATGTGTTPAQP
jgi:hypothetical protein